jgi:hypothetical protein
MLFREPQSVVSQSPSVFRLESPEMTSTEKGIGKPRGPSLETMNLISGRVGTGLIVLLSSDEIVM